jgi:hypothetical protein
MQNMPLSFRFMQQEEAPAMGQLIVQSVLQQRGSHAIKGCPDKIANVWTQIIGLACENKNYSIVVASDADKGNYAGLLAWSWQSPDMASIEHLYTLPSPYRVGKALVHYMVTDNDNISKIKVMSARSAIGFYKKLKFESEYGQLATELTLGAQGIAALKRDYNCEQLKQCTYIHA